MRWRLSHRAGAAPLEIADRHYNRQKPGTPQFVPPGRCMVLYAETDTGRAAWVTSWPFAKYVKHAWAGAWVNSLFRNEGAGLSSELIRQAVAATRWYHENTENWIGDIPALGMITFVDPRKVKSRNPGYCYQCAGFRRVGMTKGGLVAWQLLPVDIPEACAPVGAQLPLFEDAA